MVGQGESPERFGRVAHALALMAARRARPAKGFVSQPEPRSIGVFGRGKQLVAGNILLAGHLVEAPEQIIWDITAPDTAFAADAQGFAWLDDLAAFGTAAARKRAQDWTWDWIARYGRGRGPGWSPDLTGRRIIRWVHHATLLLSGRDRAQTEAFYHALARQSIFLSRRWQAAAPGLPRFEALTGLVYAGLSLIGMDRLVPAASTALAAACKAEIDGKGAIPSRNPEELLEILTLLNWSASAMTEAAHPVPSELAAAISRIAPSLRALRHSDGELARFHGGGKGGDGHLDQALAASGVRKGQTPPVAMGFARLYARRTSVIVDAAAAPGGRAATTAHASTTAFELTSGRRPLIVNCGAGGDFGPAWRQAARATQSHSVLCLDGFSSSRFGARDGALDQRAAIISARMSAGSESTDLYLAHDGWVATHGLTASRSLSLAPDGRRLSGEDVLAAIDDAARRRLQDLLTTTKMEAGRFAIRFHLHPEVDVSLDMAGTAVSMGLRSGEVWVFRFSGPARLSLEPSAYLDKGRVNPRPCTQIVLRSQMRGFETRIGWTLAKAKDTPLAIRDLEGADLDV